MTEYPEDTRSLVHVQFVDGSEETFPMSASPMVARSLAELLNERASLHLYTATTNVTIPRERIHFYEIEAYAR